MIVSSRISRAALRREARRGQCLAERGHEGSRGLQPADWEQRGLRRGATREEAKEPSSVAPRRGLPPASNRGLKPTATVAWSLRDQTARGSRRHFVKNEMLAASLLSTPTALCPPAQGCEARVTLGVRVVDVSQPQRCYAMDARRA